MLSLSLKQKLIDDGLSKSYEIALGNGAFGHCLVWLMFPSFKISLFLPLLPSIPWFCSQISLNHPSVVFGCSCIDANFQYLY